MIGGTLSIEKDTGYTVKTVNNCKIMYGAIPVDDMQALIKMVPKKAIMDIHVAQYLGATMVFGLKEDTKSLLTALPPSEERRREAGQPNLPDGLANWLTHGQRGNSSNAIVDKLLHKYPDGADYAHPYDPSDLERCLLLLDAVPDFKARISEMSSASPDWAKLITRWGEITELFNSEAGNTQNWKAPKTLELMREVLSSPSPSQKGPR